MSANFLPGTLLKLKYEDGLVWSGWGTWNSTKRSTVLNEYFICVDHSKILPRQLQVLSFSGMVFVFAAAVEEI